MKSWRREQTTDDGRRRTTDESPLEKLRCHSAGGAKNLQITWNTQSLTACFLKPLNHMTYYL